LTHQYRITWNLIRFKIQIDIESALKIVRIDDNTVARVQLWVKRKVFNFSKKIKFSLCRIPLDKNDMVV